MPDCTLTVTQNQNVKKISADTAASLLDTLRNAGYSGIHAPCGGRGLCRQCKINVTGPLTHVEDPNSHMSAVNSEILACRWKPDGDCAVFLPEDATMEIVVGEALLLSPGGKGLGVAVDIGTTTVAAYLYDLASGERLGVESGRNAQRPYGADVISRILYADKGNGLNILSGVIRNQISTAVDALCSQTKRQRADIERVSIAGNTVMEHIFDGLSPTGIGVAPFKTVSLFGDCRPAEPIFKGLARDAKVYICPALAGYVGGDITAGLMSSGAHLLDATCLFIDIGTNGEMALGDSSGFICCATAAGPAFEGAEIECGMDGSAGAISKVAYADETIEFDTIGGVTAKGICGSGLIDAMATMLLCGAVDESGRMLRPEEAPEPVKRFLRSGEDGAMRFHFTEKVFVSAADVRQLQLAKAAIRAGIETLLELRGKSYEDISSVLLAGGFGAFMDIKSACALGLLPPAMLGKTRHVGNSSGAGAVMALEASNREVLKAVTSKCEYHELSASKIFMEKYIECMTFEEYEEVYK